MSAFSAGGKLSHLVVFPQAPHPCYLADPARFTALVLEFADRHGAAAGLPVVADWSQLGAPQQK